MPAFYECFSNISKTWNIFNAECRYVNALAYMPIIFRFHVPWPNGTHLCQIIYKAGPNYFFLNKELNFSVCLCKTFWLGLEYLSPNTWSRLTGCEEWRLRLSQQLLELWDSWEKESTILLTLSQVTSTDKLLIRVPYSEHPIY